MGVDLVMHVFVCFSVSSFMCFVCTCLLGLVVACVGLFICGLCSCTHICSSVHVRVCACAYACIICLFVCLFVCSCVR